MMKYPIGKLSLCERDARAIGEFRDKVYDLLGGKLKRLMLFGSKAEGMDTPESDIDIMILIVDSAMNMWERIIDLAFEVNLKYDVYISPRIISLAIYNHPVWGITPFIKGLKTRGVDL